MQGKSGLLPPCNSWSSINRMQTHRHTSTHTLTWVIRSSSQNITGPRTLSNTNTPTKGAATKFTPVTQYQQWQRRPHYRDNRKHQPELHASASAHQTHLEPHGKPLPQGPTRPAAHRRYMPHGRGYHSITYMDRSRNRAAEPTTKTMSASASAHCQENKEKLLRPQQ